MLQTVFTSAVVDLVGELIKAEVDIANGFPQFTVVGLPDIVVREAKERIRTAIINSGMGFPQSRVTVNLLPTSCKKAGSHLDLPIALGVLCAAHKPLITQVAALGELSLTGDVLAVKSILPLLIAIQRNGIRQAIIPMENLEEAMALEHFEVFPVENIAEAYRVLKNARGMKPIMCIGQHSVASGVSYDGVQLADICGQSEAKRVIEISAAGGHHLMMMGPPGCGKTMLAQAMTALLPPIDYEEQMLLTELHGNQLVNHRPFRSPHYTITRTALCGGGGWIRPGEVTLSHLGVLYLDEFLEFSRETIEALRYPMEAGEIHISRVSGQVTLPARFTLVASFNPCPCGNLGDDERSCQCTPSTIRRYRQRLSGPILDRFDLQVMLSRISYDDLGIAKEDSRRIESLHEVTARVQQARRIQQRRFKSSMILNAHMTQAQLHEVCKVNRECASIIERLERQYQLSARGIFKVLRVARTIADLAGSSNIEKAHILEAAHYRHIEREVFSRGY